MNAKLFTETAPRTADAILALLEKHADEIIRDWQQTEAAAVEQKKKHAPIKVSFAVTIEPSAGTRKHKISWGVRKSDETVAVDGDPNQTELGMEVKE